MGEIQSREERDSILNLNKFTYVFDNTKNIDIFNTFDLKCKSLMRKIMKLCI